MATALHLFIITGASRGMGAAIAEQLLAPGHALLCISRHRNERLADLARSHGAACEQWTLDLGLPAEAADRLRGWLETSPGGQPAADWASATLINNAALLPRSVPLADAGAAEVANALRVGLEAPMLLTAAFLRATADWPGARRVLNISSGLGRRAMASQAPYCAVKAGMDHFSRAVALEEAARGNGARIVSLAPGVIDTDMQAQLRGADPATFPDRANFVDLKQSGRLASSADAAAGVLAFLRRPDFGGNPVADVRDA